MVSEAEIIVERRRFRRRLLFWRVAAAVLLVAALLAFAGGLGGFADIAKQREHIARVKIDGLITGDQSTLDLLKEIADSKAAKGLIIRIDSPGGTTAGSEALYEAIGRAYDFSLAAADAPAEFDEIVADSGLTMQDRAPMTPVVKLVFGADYDKTRLTEYAAALTHAHRLQLPQGTLGEFLSEHDGGLKGVVKAERRLRREEAGKVVEPLDAPRHALAKKLRALPPQDLADIAIEGSEFALVLIRRTEDGDVVMLGEVPDDIALLERAARKIVG